MNEHAPHHAEVLKRIVSGELGPEADEALDVLGGCPDCRAKLRDLQAVTKRLAAAGALVRQDLARAETEDDEPALVDVGAVLRRQIERKAGPARSRRLAAWLVGAAAVLLLAVLWRARDDAGSPGPDGPGEVLMGTEIELLAPAGEGVSYRTFAWRHDLGPGGWFEVRVYDALVEAASAPLASSPRLLRPRWEPRADETKDWPDSIRWEVEAFDASGAAVGFATGRASR